MPAAKTQRRAKAKLRRGNSPKTAAGEYIREEIHHVRKGKHGARSTKQAIALGLSKARRAGIPIGDPGPKASARTRQQAKRDSAAGKHPHAPSKTRSKASLKALKREPHSAASHAALSKHAKAARKRK